MSTARWTAALATGAALASMVGLVAASAPASAATVTVTTATATTATTGSATTATAPAHGRIDAAALRAALGGLPDPYVRGAMVTVTGRDGRWTGTAGEWTAPVDGQFAVGSVTKLFTAAIALQLVGEGRLSLDDTVQDLLPGLLPSSYAPITVGQLLSHSSGLQKPECARPGTPVEVVTSAVSCGTPKAPGATVQYNGINYFLAGLVIEEVTGRSYGEELRDRVVRPLGLRHTSLPADDWAWAEGGLVSTAGDLRRFMNVLMRGGLHRPAERTSLFTVPPIPGANFSYGGLMRTPAPGGGPLVWGKTGTNRGYTSGVFATPGADRVVVYSTLTTGKDATQETDRVLRIVGAAFKGYGEVAGERGAGGV
ncbi:serine hydrolase domain-containing protein [Streptomyces sp. P9(2023)]|uniref:serine hydrolase domain-containing protein n=1 Tax=Streptomyces sp. P9(2023) TaxID=3064394 RepID=UPI0028F40070|nr:serine hydrolase domain-containing protein [Streptomyces sp. P9(2023)]MDT9688764.1 serine hydrolase domain-containing protein [Streptomyces sp. P9(2023)]